MASMGYNVVYLDDNEFYLKDDNDVINIETDYTSRFKTMLSLISCCEEWEENKLNDGIFCVDIISDEERRYAFNEPPFNWQLFIGYIYRLVGESLWDI